MATKPNRVEVEIVATDEASPKIDRLEKKIDGLESDEARVVVTADISRLEKQLAGSRRLMEEMEGDELTVQARVTGRIEEDLEAALRLFNELDGKTGTVSITANARQLEDEARRAADGVDQIGRSANSSRSVLANMVGNTTQDLGALGGIAGSTGVAIGQMGEYMADARFEGEGLSSVLRNFGKVAIPIAGVAGAMLLVSQGAKQAKERADDLTESINELTSATDAAVLATWNQMVVRAVLDGKDLQEQLDDLAKTNEVGARRLLEVAEAAGINDEALQMLQTALNKADIAAARAEESQRKYGDALDETADAAVRAGDAATIIANEIDLARSNVQRFGDDGVEEMGNVESAARDTAVAVREVKDRWAELREEIAEGKAARDAERQLIQLKELAEEAFIAQATGADDARLKMLDLEDQIDDTLLALAEGGAPPTIVATVEAFFDQGKFLEGIYTAQGFLNRNPLTVPINFAQPTLSPNQLERLSQAGRLAATNTLLAPSRIQPAGGVGNVTIINPPGTPAATAGQLEIYLARNGEGR